MLKALKAAVDCAMVITALVLYATADDLNNPMHELDRIERRQAAQ